LSFQDWFAFVGNGSEFNFTLVGEAFFPNTGNPSSDDNYGFCQVSIFDCQVSVISYMMLITVEKSDIFIHDKFEGGSNKQVNEFNKISITRVVFSKLKDLLIFLACFGNLTTEEHCSLTGLNAFSVSLHSKCSSTPPLIRLQLYLFLFIMIMIVK